MNHTTRSVSRPRRALGIFSSACLAVALAGCSSGPTKSSTPGWYRGNTHTHTLWSDGDAAPEHAIKWYAENGYDFLVLSDHNIVQDVEKWFPIASGGRLSPEQVDALRADFGRDWVDLRFTNSGDIEMRLKTLDELRSRFEGDSFILVTGEEVTDQFADKPVHINAVNTASLVGPQGGSSVLDTIQRNLDAIQAHGKRTGRATLGHVNHPNFGWGITAGELASIRGEHFFEVYNGHRSVRNDGDADHPSLEAMWDHALTVRLTTTGELLFGLATDDAHNHFDANGHSVPGRGWVVVNASGLEGDLLVEAMQRGDFYASSGVELNGVHQDGGSLRVEIRTEPGVTYETRFIGTRRTADGSHGPEGEVFATTSDNPAVYPLDGSELYVRAVVVSSELHPRPYLEGDHQMAWVQPMVPGRAHEEQGPGGSADD